jgi:hypothetical protein
MTRQDLVCFPVPLLSNLPKIIQADLSRSFASEGPSRSSKAHIIFKRLDHI